MNNLNLTLVTPSKKYSELPDVSVEKILPSQQETVMSHYLKNCAKKMHFENPLVEEPLPIHTLHPMRRIRNRSCERQCLFPLTTRHRLVQIQRVDTQIAALMQEMREIMKQREQSPDIKANWQDDDLEILQDPLHRLVLESDQLKKVDKEITKYHKTVLLFYRRLAETVQRVDKKQPEPVHEFWGLRCFEDVLYSHPSISSKTRDSAYSLQDLSQKISTDGWLSNEPLSLIEYEKGKYSSWNNRRLYCLKEIAKRDDSSVILRNYEKIPATKLKKNRREYVHVEIVQPNWPVKSQDMKNILKRFHSYQESIQSEVTLDKIHLLSRRASVDLDTVNTKGLNCRPVMIPWGLEELCVGYENVVVREWSDFSND